MAQSGIASVLQFYLYTLLSLQFDTYAPAALEGRAKASYRGYLPRQGRFCVAAYRIREECVLLQPSIRAAVQVRFGS